MKKTALTFMLLKVMTGGCGLVIKVVMMIHLMIQLQNPALNKQFKII